MPFGPIENQPKLIFLYISTHITLRFLLKNYWKLCLVASTTFKLQWNLFIFLFLAWNMQPLCHKMLLKIRSEPHIQIFKMAALLPPGYCTTNHGKSLAFSFSVRERDFLRDYDVITGGFLQKLGIPRDFVTISCRNVSYRALRHPNLK